MHLLDADTITFLHEGHPRMVERLNQCDDPEIGIAIVTKAEVFRGRIEFLLKAANSEEILRAQALLKRSESLLGDLPLVSFDRRAGTEFERLRKLKGARAIGHVDLMVASIALANHATLVTRNLRHFRQIPGLKLENWVD